MLICTMADFTCAQKADMHYMYCRANGIGRAALRMYHAHFPNRRMPDHITFQPLHRQLSETDLLHLLRHEAVDEELYAVLAWKKAS